MGVTVKIKMYNVFFFFLFFIQRRLKKAKTLHHLSFKNLKKGLVHQYRAY